MQILPISGIPEAVSKNPEAAQRIFSVLKNQNDIQNQILFNKIQEAKAKYAEPQSKADLEHTNLSNLMDQIKSKYMPQKSQAEIDLINKGMIPNYQAESGKNWAEINDINSGKIPLAQAQARNYNASSEDSEMQNNILRRVFGSINNQQSQGNQEVPQDSQQLDSDTMPLYSGTNAASSRMAQNSPLSQSNNSDDVWGALEKYGRAKMLMKGEEPTDIKERKALNVMNEKAFENEYKGEQSLAVKDSLNAQQTISTMKQLKDAMNTYHSKHGEAPKGLPSLLDAAKFSDNALNQMAKYDPDLSRVMLLQRQLGVQAFELAKNVRTQREFNYIVGSVPNLSMQKDALNDGIDSSIALLERKKDFNEFLSSEKKNKTPLSDVATKWTDYESNSPLIDKDGKVIKENIHNFKDYFAGNVNKKADNLAEDKIEDHRVINNDRYVKTNGKWHKLL